MNFFDNHLLSLYEQFSNSFEKNSNLFFIFGSSYRELHIQVLIRKLSSNSNNKIVWIRSFDLIDKLDKLKKEETKKSLQKFVEEYDENGHLIIFTKDDIEGLSRNDVLGLINSKIENLFSNGVSFYERKLFTEDDEQKFKNPWYLINEAVNEYDKNNNKKSFLDNLLEIKDFNFICWILLNSENFHECFEWYIENIDKFSNTIIDINWFISTVEFNEEKYKSYADLVLKCCSNMDIKDIKSNDIIDWIKLVDVSKHDYKWIIMKIWDVLTNIEKTSDWYKLYHTKIEEIEFLKENNKDINDFIVS
ncbi:MAG: hypothetical protein K2I49_00725, partial [Ureaplasma sp.]|nr:hypothetical protein [Ureaplasma sp.]